MLLFFDLFLVLYPFMVDTFLFGIDPNTFARIIFIMVDKNTENYVGHIDVVKFVNLFR